MPKSLRTGIYTAAVLFILIGLVLIIWPVQARLIICYTVGALFILAAVGCVGSYFTRQSFFGLSRFGVIAGIVSAVIGLFLLFKANAVSAAAGVIIGVAIIADSLMRLQLALDARRFNEKWALPLGFALAMLVIGIVLLFNPFASITAATIVAGCALLADGILSLWSTIVVNKLFH